MSGRIGMADIYVYDVTPPGWGEKLIASYLVVGKRAVLIETGPRSSAEKLIEELRRDGFKPDKIIVTHIHLDHAGGVGVLAREFNAEVVVHPRGLKHLADPSKLWAASRAVLGPIAEVYGEPVPVPEELLCACGDNGTINLDESRLRLLYTPGHASHHQVVLLEPEGILFTGDAAGVSVEVDGDRIRLPTTPPPFRPKLYIESLQRMAELRPERVAPTHYGFDPMDGLEYINYHMLQLKTWLDEVEKLVKEGITDPDEAARILASRLPEARKALKADNKIIYVTFYKSTVWGMIEYFKEKEFLGGKS
ncbi:MAG: MBL fold metallo-hydrolase [Desulfurococcales archaeon]|nr:MBL fold metallo-hydrolase [Desulfurococcales archaeon]